MKQKLLKLEKMIVGIPQQLKVMYKAALEHFKTASIKIKDLSNTNYELGLFHIDKGNLRDAEMRFLFVLRLKKDFALAHYHLARCYLFNVKFDKAKKELEIALALDPSLEIAQYRLNLANQEIKNLSISVEATKEDYNALAYKYEKFMLEDLDYSAPELLSQAIASFIEHQNLDTQNLKCLDIGCGTGLAGGCLRSEVALKSLLGIDISSNMLNLAKTLEINDKVTYTETREFDFHNLELLSDDFDIIISCMSLGYAKNITSVLSQLNKIAHNGTIFGLVVLKSEKGDFSINYEYACMEFGELFLIDIFDKLGWLVQIKENITLFNNGVVGHLFVLIKK